jgi:hypothetical protein
MGTGTGTGTGANFPSFPKFEQGSVLGCGEIDEGWLIGINHLAYRKSQLFHIVTAIVCCNYSCGI